VDIWKAKQEAALMIGVAPGTVQFDRGVSGGTGWVQPLRQFSVEQESEPTPSAPVLTTSFNGINYTGSFPPDPVMAAGPTNLVLSTNGSVTIRDKTGTLVASTSLLAFFGSVRASGENTFDPRVLFDTGSNRFFLAAVGRIANTTCTAGTCVSHFFLAVSKTAAPTTTGSGDWFFYAFDGTLDGSTPTTNWADFPALGVDSSVVVLTANMFSFSNSTFQKAKIRIFNKSVLIAGGAVTWFDFVGMTDPGSGINSFTLQPALTFGSPGTFFLVSASNTPNSCNLVVWGIQNPLSSPVLSSRLATAGGTCLTPPDAQQLGGGTPLDTGDTRLLNAVYRNNSLWTAQSIQMNFGSGNVSAIRWVQINVGAWPSSVSLIQDSTFGVNGVWNFYPAVMVDASDNLALVFARSSASQFGSARYTARLVTDPANTLQPSALLKAGAATYLTLDSIGRNRWGDYLGVGLDPSDGSVWLLGEYAASSTTWGTWVGQLGFANVITPHTLTITSGPSGSPNPVASGGTASLSVGADDSLDHSLNYTWTALCPTLGSNGTFNNAAAQTPAWTAPPNATGSQQTCTIQVTVSDGQGLSQVGSYAQGVSATASSSRLTNISTRGRVETGDNVMIAGFIIGGTTPKTVLVRVDGPSLTAFGVPGALADPVLRLFSGQTAIAENDDWQVTQPLCQQSGYTCGTPAAIAATGLAPTNPLESAILITLAPGAYTALVSGFAGTTGVGLVAVFEVATQ